MDSGDNLTWVHSLWTWFLGAPLASVIIVAGGLFVVVVSRWLLGRVMRRLADSSLPSVDADGRVTMTLGAVPGEHARARRISTLHQLLSSTIGVVTTVVVVIMVLAEWGVDVRPLLASAGIVGLAIAFGAQSIVSDTVSGLLMLTENQYNVGDRVELATAANVLAAGTVEEVGLRVTTVRADDGQLWYVRNGQIVRVANESQGWSLAVVDIALAPGADVSAVRESIDQLVTSFVAEDAMEGVVLPDHAPSVRVSDITADSAVIRVRVPAEPGQNHRLASILRQRIYAYLTAHGIALA